MKATVKAELSEQSKYVTAHAKIELENEVGSIEDIKELKRQVMEVEREMFKDLFTLSQDYSRRK